MMAPYGAAWFPALHCLAGLFFAVGAVLLLAWAIKHLSGEKQKYWGGMFILAAIVLWLVGMTLSIAMGGKGDMMAPKTMMKKDAMMAPRQAAQVRGESKPKPQPTTGRGETQPKSR